MAQGEETEVLRWPTLWRDSAGQPWLAVVEFAKVAGRTECVGLQVRSYVEDVQRPEREFVRHHRDKEPLAPDEARELMVRWAKREGPLDYDADALLAGGYEEPELRPRPLRATTLRELPVGYLQMEGRRRFGVAFAQAFHLGGEALVQLWNETRPTIDDEDSPEAQETLHEFAGLLQATREIRERGQEIKPPGRKGGRRPAYGRSELERVAELYKAAYTSGSTQPTKDTAAALGLTWSQAAKRIMRCRTLGLLGSTEPGQAGGVSPADKESP